MLPYAFQNNYIKFYKYKCLVDNEYHYFMDKETVDNNDFIKIDSTEYSWIESIYMTNTMLANVLMKDTNINKNTAVRLLTDLLNSSKWEYGSWKIDKIHEYELVNKECPYSEDEINNLHLYREKVREIIRFYESI